MDVLKCFSFIRPQQGIRSNRANPIQVKLIRLITNLPWSGAVWMDTSSAYSCASVSIIIIIFFFASCWFHVIVVKMSVMSWLVIMEINLMWVEMTSASNSPNQSQLSLAGSPSSQPPEGASAISSATSNTSVTSAALGCSLIPRSWIDWWSARFPFECTKMD